MATFLVYFLIFGLALVYLPFGSSSFEIPKVIMAEFAIALLTFLTIRKQKFSFNLKLLLPVIAIFVLSIFHLFFGYKEYTFFGNPFRLQGTFFLWNLLLFTLISSFAGIKLPNKWGLISFVAIIISIFIFGVDGSSRFVGSLGEPNSLAIYLLFLWPFIPASPKLKYVIICAVVVLIFLTGSKSGLLGLGLQLIFLGLSKIIKIKSAVFITLVLLLTSLSLPFIFDKTRFEDRSEIWKNSFTAGLSSPLLGSGFGNIEYAIKEVTLKSPGNLKYVYIDSAHNIFLDWFISGGAAGVALLTYLVLFTFINLAKNKDHLKLLAFIGILAGAFFNPLSVAVLIPLFWLIGSSFNFRGRFS